jgi:NTP pyrophosphatase (non-canonical NTP hydrolase)
MEMNLEDIVKLAQSTATEVWGPRDPIKILEKLKEEVDELCEAVAAIRDLNNLDMVHPQLRLEVKKEFGDVLFCMVRFADQIKLIPKDALALTIVKIQERDKFGVANVRTDKEG